MDIFITNIVEENEELKFTLENANVSLANAVRRVILANIPIIVFRTSPYEQNDAEFIINTSRFNNEILKQRLSCIPIHIDDIETPIEDYLLEVDVKNDTDNIIYVTTADFKIKNIKTDKYLNDNVLKNIFPPDPITGEYIDFARLRPKISETIDGEHLKFTCKFSKGIAKENNSFNCVSTCAYRNSPDYEKIEQVWLLKEGSIDKEKEDVEFLKKDFMLLDAKRYFVPDSFDFTIESIGIYDNKTILIKAIEIIIQKLKNQVDIHSNANEFIKVSETTMQNCYDIILEGEDYTLGKVLEYLFYSDYFENQQILSFCGFQKPHPHIDVSIIRLAYKNEVEVENITANLLECCNKGMEIYSNLLKQINSQM